MRLLAMAAAMVMAAGAANAAVVNYTYIGNDVSRCGDLTRDCFEPAEVTVGMAGSITIDTSSYLTGQLANSAFWISAQFEDYYDQTGLSYSYRITRGDRSESKSSIRSLSDISFIVDADGLFDTFLFPGEVSANYTYMSFGRDGEVTSWFGNDADGGSTDQYWSSVTGDTFGGTSGGPSCQNGDLCTPTPGTWTRTVISDTPSPVPLPASAFLMLMALGSVGLAGRRRMQRPA